MPVRIIDDTPLPGILARDMSDGQIARVIAWSSNNEHWVGQIVQRLDTSLIIIGRGKGPSWPGAFDSPGLTDACRVEILPDGEYRWEVFDNNE